MRSCPLCLSSSSLNLYTYRLTSGIEQSILACECGMVYASTYSPSYENSIYSVQGAIGSGISLSDRKRLRGTAEIISRYIPKNASILDIGCAQGGLLDAFRELGYTNLLGLDPSRQCSEKTIHRGHKAVCGSLSDLDESFDCIVLSHVLEHIDDPKSFLSQIRSKLTMNGQVYIEVPDASRYSNHSLPFLDFNSEHINHFSMSTLKKLIESCGFNIIQWSEREIELTSGAAYPAIYVIAVHSNTAGRIMEYVRESSALLEKTNAKLDSELSEYKEIAIWGAGEYLAHVLSLPAILSRSIVLVVDRNPLIWGKEVAGCIVGPPDAMLPNIPIVIAAIVAEKSIRQSATNLGFTNPMISL